MKSKAKSWSNLGVIGSIVGLATASISTLVMASLPIQSVLAESSSQQNNPRIAPIQSHPSGKSYSQWAATWWKWALENPASTNPLLDKGECSVGQKGRVWFIGGTFSGEAVVRDCTVPPGTSLFFPLINSFYGAFTTDPPEQRTEKFVRDQVACTAPPTLLQAEIDGVPVKKPSQYFEKSPLFNVQLLTDNIYGVDQTVIPELRLSPSVDEGYYLFLEPLKPGKHTIKWQAKISCANGNSQQNITYNIVVKSERD